MSIGCGFCCLWIFPPIRIYFQNTTDEKINSRLGISSCLGLTWLVLGIIECVDWTYCNTKNSYRASCSISTYEKFSAITDTIIGSLILLGSCAMLCYVNWEKNKKTFQHIAETLPFAPPQTTSTQYV